MVGIHEGRWALPIYLKKIFGPSPYIPWFGRETAAEFGLLTHGLLIKMCIKSD
jgi:hypothetical protein